MTAAEGAFLDQLRAAQADAFSRMEKAEATGAGTIRYGSSEVVAQLLRRVTLTRLRPCPHLRVGAPEPMFLPVWQSKVCCAACLPRCGLPSDAVEAHTCDLCRRYCRGDMHCAFALVSCVYLLFGACGSCKVRVSAPPTSATGDSR